MRRVLAGFCFAVIAACASVSGIGGPGYKEEMVSASRYRVTYTAPEGVKAALIADRTLAHAAQLTLDKGNEWFEIAGKIDGENSQTLVIEMGSGEQLAGGSARVYDAKETLARLRPRIG